MYYYLELLHSRGTRLTLPGERARAPATPARLSPEKDTIVLHLTLYKRHIYLCVHTHI